MQLRHLEPWAARHHGLITHRAALDIGLSPSAWYRATRSGELDVVHPGVARLRGAPRTQVQQIHAAVLTAGSTGMASHRSAAVLWGVERPDHDPVDIVVDRCVTRLDLDGVVVHRPTDRLDMRLSFRHTTRCTNLLRTLVDLGAVFEPGDDGVADAVSQAITSGVVTPTVLARLLDRHARPGRHGTAALRRALEAWPLQGKPADSELEVRTARLLRDHRLPPATFHARVAGFEVDFLVDDSAVVLECDGWDFHSRTREQVEWHTERDQILGAHGYVVFHFTWRQVTRRSAATARRIRQLLHQWAPHVLTP
jgi:very-short-patch-repair endonuclease